MCDCNCFSFLVNNNAAKLSNTAFVSDNKRLSFASFFDDVRRFSAFLYSKGVRRGSTVTLCLPNSVEFALAFYAACRLGAAANLVHHSVGKTGVLLSACEAGSKIIIAQSSVFCGGEKVDFNSAVNLGGTLPEPGEAGCGDDIAVLVHGGGTAGEEKTAALSNRAINSVARSLAFIDKNHGEKDEFSLLVLPLFHTFGLVSAMHFPLSCGFGCIAVPKFNAVSANELIKKENITFIAGVPEMFKKLLSAGNFGGSHLKKLRFMFCGGDAVPQALVDRVNDEFVRYSSPARLFVGYGLTEVCSACCINSFDYCRADSVGRALEGIKLGIFDAGGKRITDASVGEIGVCGDTVMNGYFRGDLHSLDGGEFAFDGGDGYLLTGDMGHIDEDGFLFFEGRKKRMYVISGYNIYPESIERLALKCSAVSDACCVVGEEGSTKKIVLFVTLNGGTAVPEELEALIKASLPAYSLPQSIVVLDALPRTALGKKDYKKLTDGVFAAAGKRKEILK